MYNLLHSAAKSGSTENAAFIIDSCIDSIEETDSNGNTPLNVAVLHRNLAVAALLLQKRANPYTRNNAGVSPATCIKNSPSLIELGKFLS
jgi:ankyrin repeat protein